MNVSLHKVCVGTIESGTVKNVVKVYLFFIWSVYNSYIEKHKKRTKYRKNKILISCVHC